MTTSEIPVALRSLSYFWVQFRRTWKADIGTVFLTPVLFLASMGLGLGGLIGNGQAVASLGGVSYLSFVALALLATTAMQVAMIRATYEDWRCAGSWPFFPLSQLPVALQYLAYALPLWHGVELSRGLYAGHLDVAVAMGSVAYLLAVSAAGTIAARASCQRELSK